MYKVSVSKIKTVNSFYTGAYGTTERDAIEMIQGVKKFTVSKGMGTLVDAYIMDGLTGSNDYTKLSRELDLDITSSSEVVDLMDKYIDQFKRKYPHYLAQSSHSKIYPSILGDIEVSMRLDILTPNKVIDIKTSKYRLDPESINNFQNDIQGMFYTNAYEVDQMEYHHFVIDESAKSGYRLSFSGVVKQSYASDDEVVKHINRFMGFVQSRNLLKYVMPKTW